MAFRDNYNRISMYEDSGDFGGEEDFPIFNPAGQQSPLSQVAPAEVDYFAQQFAPDEFAQTPVVTTPVVETPAATTPVVETPAYTPIVSSPLSAVANENKVVFEDSSPFTPEATYTPPASTTAVATETAKPTDTEIVKFLTDNPNVSDADIATVMQTTGLTPADVARATGANLADVTARYDAVTSPAKTGALEQATSVDSDAQGTSNLGTPTQTPTGGLPTTTKLTEDKKVQVIDNLSSQILGQNLTSKWTGEGYGSAEANAKDMAKIMADIGITDIKQFGKVPVLEQATVKQGYNGQAAQQDEDGNYFIVQPSGEYDSEGNQISTRVNVDPSKLEKVYGTYQNLTGNPDDGSTFVPVDQSKLVIKDGATLVQTGTTFGNKETGQAVPNTYSERQKGNFFGGTFAGKGNTGYGVQFDAQGNPYFFTQGASSNDLANIMKDLGPLGQVAIAVATGGLSIPQQIAANMAIQVLSGKDIGDAIKGAALSYAGSQIPGLDAIKEGTSFIKDLGLSAELTNTLTKSFQNAAISGGTALLSGKNVGDAMIKGAVTGGTSGAVDALLGNIDGFKDLSPAQKNMAVNAVTGVISGKPLDQIVINTAISAANAEIAKAKNENTALNPYFTPTGGLATADAGATTDTTTTPSGLQLASANTGTTSDAGSNFTLGGVDAKTQATLDAIKDVNNIATGTTTDTTTPATTTTTGGLPTTTAPDTEFGDLKAAQDAAAARNAGAVAGTTADVDKAFAEAKAEELKNNIANASSRSEAFKLAREGGLGAKDVFTDRKSVV